MNAIRDRALVIVIALLLTIAPSLAALAAGDGSLTPHPVTPAFGSGGAFDVALGDLDGDGDLDAVAASAQESAWLNNGVGSFAPHPTAPSFGSGTDLSPTVALGDLDGDGDLDAIVTNVPGPNTVWLNDGSGAFTAHPTVPSFAADGGIDVALADLDGDGDQDAVVARGSVANTVWLNDGSGALSAHPVAPAFGSAADQAVDVALGDLDGDGDRDAVIAGNGAASTVWLNDGSGVFAAQPSVPSIGLGNSNAVALGDLDGDGDLDAIIANDFGQAETVWLNDGAGAFAAHPGAPGFGQGGSQSVALGDLEADGDLDAVVANYDAASTVWVNDGSGVFAPHPLIPSIGSSRARAVTLGEIDGDGDLDALLATDTATGITVWVNGASTVVPEVVGDGTPASCTEAALDAALADGGLITFNCGGTPENPVTITVTNRKRISAGTSIDGGDSIVISGGGTTGVFAVAADTRLALANLTIRDAVSGSTGFGGAIQSSGGDVALANVRMLNNRGELGGAIHSVGGTLAITGSTFTGNVAGFDGGALLSSGSRSLTITHSTFTENVAGVTLGGISGFGGAIAYGGIPRARIVDSVISGNVGLGTGGGVHLFSNSQMTISGSTITGNTVAGFDTAGGGIRSDGLLTIEHTTIAENGAVNGGGIYSNGQLTVTDSTVSGNRAANVGGGVYVNDGSTSIGRSEVVNNRADNAAGGIASRARLGVVDSTVSGNRATNAGAGIWVIDDLATVRRSTISNNSTPGGGGGVYVTGTLEVNDSTLSANDALHGGAIFVDEAAAPGSDIIAVTVIESTLSANEASELGGGIYAQRGLLIERSLLAGNRAQFGGAILLARGAQVDSAFIADSTLSGNTAEQAGGAVFVDAEALGLYNSTLSGNSAAPGNVPASVSQDSLNAGGTAKPAAKAIFGDASASAGTLDLKAGESSVASDSAAPDDTSAAALDEVIDGAGIFNNGATGLFGTIVANSVSGHNCRNFFGEIASSEHNLDSDGSCQLSKPSDLSNTDPLLGPLQDNGGPTQTHALLAGSPAVDAGRATCDASDRFGTHDQRGVERPQGSACDIGAYELVDSTPPVVTPLITGILGQDGWYVGDVTVTWDVAEPDSPLTATDGCDPTTITTDTAGTTLTCTATSTGGTSSASVTIKRDATAPALAPSVSPNPVLLNGSATASPNATDATSGIATASCDAVDSSSVGAKTVSCAATDNAGNTASAQASYIVTYNFDGFFSPIENDALNVAKAGRAIPLKFHLTDATGAPITTLSTAVIASVSLDCTSLSTGGNPVEEYAAGSSGLQNHGNGYYQINWKSASTYAGTCRQLRLDLGEGSTASPVFHVADFSFK